MTTKVTITGIGCPIPTAEHAGPGVLVRYADGTEDEIHLQFDAGRSTTMRLMGAGSSPSALDAVFLTHHHSDHCTGLQDVVLTRWVMDRSDSLPPLEIVAPEGPAAAFARHMLEVWADDLAVRMEHTGRSREPHPTVTGFALGDRPELVWSRGPVRVLAGQVRHEPVHPAVGYRIETPDGVIAITGDTLVCDEVAVLATGADVLVYEAMRFSVFDGMPRSRTFILDYHADTTKIGEQAASLGTPTLVLTHLIPPPRNAEDRQLFSDDVRAAGYEGSLVVADDLTELTLERGQALRSSQRVRNLR